MPPQPVVCAIKSSSSDIVARIREILSDMPITLRDIPRRDYSSMDARCARRLTDFCPGVSVQYRLHCQRHAQNQSRYNGQSHIFSSTLTVVHDARDI
jgi:hypothetical protein